jgi:prepilin-type processing-associated H-X9-DG protein/prepilin-type N-terminal cleavage/methylation domain-containing protein
MKIGSKVSFKKTIAFTLIEVLVVITIIAVLTACLVPTFMTMRERSRQLQCASNLKQLGVAFYLYADEHDGIYPKAWDVSTGLRWNDELLRYLSSVDAGKRVLVCPTARADAFEDWSVYKKNGWQADPAVWYDSHVILVFDGVQNGAAAADSSTYMDHFTNRHSGVANYLFGDGHVEAMNSTAETNWVLRR